MAAALPPVTDCGCSTSSSSGGGGGSGDCCPLSGVGDPNAAGLVPPDPTVWIDYLELADLVAGPPVQTWYWNPTLAVWQ